MWVCVCVCARRTPLSVALPRRAAFIVNYFLSIDRLYFLYGIHTHKPTAITHARTHNDWRLYSGNVVVEYNITLAYYNIIIWAWTCTRLYIYLSPEQDVLFDTYPFVISRWKTVGCRPSRSFISRGRTVDVSNRSEIIFRFSAMRSITYRLSSIHT